VKRIAASRDANAVRALLNSIVMKTEASAIIEPHLVVINSESQSKVEAIKELSGMIAAAGRAIDAQSIENAVWAREETYSTGLGFGFAIPHCKTDAVHAATIAVLSLAQPVDWGSTDGQPVNVVIMLAIPDAGAAAETAKKHMQVLAGLARKLMHEDFRARIMKAKTPKAVVSAMRLLTVKK
jgi:fructose-specific PTS system IIA-like component